MRFLLDLFAQARLKIYLTDRSLPGPKPFLRGASRRTTGGGGDHGLRPFARLLFGGRSFDNHGGPGTGASLHVGRIRCVGSDSIVAPK